MSATHFTMSSQIIVAPLGAWSRNPAVRPCRGIPAKAERWLGPACSMMSRPESGQASGTKTPRTTRLASGANHGRTRVLVVTSAIRLSVLEALIYFFFSASPRGKLNVFPDSSESGRSPGFVDWRVSPDQRTFSAPMTETSKETTPRLGERLHRRPPCDTLRLYF